MNQLVLDMVQWAQAQNGCPPLTVNWSSSCIQTKKKVILPNLSRLFTHSYGKDITFYLSPEQSSYDITWCSQHWLSLKNLFAFKGRQGNICGTKIVKYFQLFYNLGVKYPSLLRKMQKRGLSIPNLNLNLNATLNISDIKDRSINTYTNARVL